MSTRIGERATLLSGLLVSLTAYLCYAFATEGWMMYEIIALSSFGGMAGPAPQSIVARRANPSELGHVQGVLASLASLTAIIAPPVATGAFWAFTAPGRDFYFPGIPFLFGSFMVAGALMVATCATYCLAIVRGR